MSDEPRPGPALGYFEGDDGIVTLRMMREDFNALVFFLGLAAAKPDFERAAKRLANRINRGRPDEAWRPYFLHQAREPEETEAP